VAAINTKTTKQMTINNKFKLGQLVFHKTDPEQMPMLITAILVGLDGGLVYNCSIAEMRNEFYEGELAAERVYNIQMN